MTERTYKEFEANVMEAAEDVSVREADEWEQDGMPRPVSGDATTIKYGRKQA